MIKCDEGIDKSGGCVSSAELVQLIQYTMCGDTETYRETPLFWIDSKIQLLRVALKIILTKQWGYCDEAGSAKFSDHSRDFAGDQFE